MATKSLEPADFATRKCHQRTECKKQSCRLCHMAQSHTGRLFCVEREKVVPA